MSGVMFRVWDGIWLGVMFVFGAMGFGGRSSFPVRAGCTVFGLGAAGKSRFVRAAVAGTVCAPSGRAGEELKDTGRGVGYDRAGPYRSG